MSLLERMSERQAPVGRRPAFTVIDAPNPAGEPDEVAAAEQLASAPAASAVDAFGLQTFHDCVDCSHLRLLLSSAREDVVLDLFVRDAKTPQIGAKKPAKLRGSRVPAVTGECTTEILGARELPLASVDAYAIDENPPNNEPS